MKKISKLLAFILALCMIFAFAACGDTNPSESTEEPENTSPAEPDTIAGTYRFEHIDEYGDSTRFSIKLRNDGTFTVMTSVGPLGDNICNGTQWTDNGDGTFTTGASDNVLELAFIAEDGSITWTILDEEGTVVPVGYTEPTEFLEKPVEDEEDSGPAIACGVYTYLESGLAPFDTLWTLTLNADGTYLLTEENERVGLVEYPGTSYTIDGSTVTCGPMGDSRPGLFSWSNPDGFVVTTGTTTFAPEGFELTEPPLTAVPVGYTVSTGTYTYLESGLAPFDTLWTLILKDDGTYLLIEENERAGHVEYPGTSYSVEGSTVVCGPMGDARPGLFSWSDPSGFSVTTGSTVFVPVGVEGVELSEEPAEAIPAGVVTKLPDITTFTYLESGLAPFDTLWTLTLNEDGTYLLIEENERAGHVEYPGTSYTRDGNSVVCGPMGDARPGLFSWSDPEGFAVTVEGKNFTPVQPEE